MVCFFYIKKISSISLILYFYNKNVVRFLICQTGHKKKKMPTSVSIVSFIGSLSQSSLAVCSRCQEKITDRVLKAVGQCFHAHCFRCSTCSCVLEGAPFITDDNNNPYCVQDYHRYMLLSCL